MNKFFCLIFCMTISLSDHVELLAQSNYPTPAKSSAHLFYIQRSGNTNTIMYDANLTADSKIASSDPIKPYWIRFAENGQKKDLSYIQRKFAYGVESRKLQHPNEFEFNIVSYSKKKLKLTLNQDGKPIALTKINGKTAILNKVFIKMDPGTMLSFTPDIKYVELFGSDPVSGEKIYEKLIL